MKKKIDIHIYIYISNEEASNKWHLYRLLNQKSLQDEEVILREHLVMGDIKLKSLRIN